MTHRTCLTLALVLIAATSCSPSSSSTPQEDNSGTNVTAVTDLGWSSWYWRTHHTGGATSTGGATGSGGMAATGGVIAAGGATGVGGTVSPGGAPTGGTTSGTTSTGGKPSAGGTTSAGGTPSSGGKPSAGGTPSTGGVTTVGGIPSAGGATSAGGMTSVGGTNAGSGTGGTAGAGADTINIGTPAKFVHPASPDPLPSNPPTGDIPSGASAFSVSIVPSRTTGVGPLYVFFDASATLTASDGKVDMEATYIWSFDTTQVDSYTKYDRVSGFVAGHVFNQPGTYTVRLDVLDANKRHGYGTTTITVSTFSGKTYYVSSGGNDANAGTLQAPFKSVAYALTFAAPNTRILFRNGDVFAVRAMSVTGKGPVIIAGYSDPAQPSSTPPEWHSTAVNTDNGILSMDTDDWRIVGLKISSGGCTSGVTNSAGVTSPVYPGAIGFHGTNNLLSRC